MEAAQALRKLPTYLAIRKFSDPPQLSDLDGFSLEEEDIKQLKNSNQATARFNYRPGNGGVPAFGELVGTGYSRPGEPTGTAIGIRSPPEHTGKEVTLLLEPIATRITPPQWVKLLWWLIAGQVCHSTNEITVHEDGSGSLPSQTSDVGLIPIAHSITHDDPIGLTRLSYLNPP